MLEICLRKEKNEDLPEETKVNTKKTEVTLGNSPAAGLDLSTLLVIRKLYQPSREREKDFKDDRREENTNIVQSIPDFQECNEEDVEIWMAWMHKIVDFKLLNDDEILSSLQEESNHVDDEVDKDQRITTTTKVARVHQMLTCFLL
ncbi:uncharacterized protein TNCV_1325511 [Trichonephila clavipes]|nr:uncharacterized protein TNCV_1325511 [Trichonephila clavipes]